MPHLPRPAPLATRTATKTIPQPAPATVAPPRTTTTTTDGSVNPGWNEVTTMYGREVLAANTTTATNATTKPATGEDPALSPHPPIVSSVGAQTPATARPPPVPLSAGIVTSGATGYLAPFPGTAARTPPTAEDHAPLRLKAFAAGWPRCASGQCRNSRDRHLGLSIMEGALDLDRNSAAGGHLLTRPDRPFTNLSRRLLRRILTHHCPLHRSQFLQGWLLRSCLCGDCFLPGLRCRRRLRRDYLLRRRSLARRYPPDRGRLLGGRLLGG